LPVRKRAEGCRGRPRLAVLLALVVVAAVVVWVSVILALGGEEPSAASGEDRGRPIPGERTVEATQGARSSEGSRIEGRYVKEGEDSSSEESGHRDPPEGGARWEPPHDPLGTGAEPGDLSETEKGRVQQAARSFVTCAYGYSGGDRSRYVSAVNRVVKAPEFYDTPGGREINAYAESVENGGTRSTAALQAFEVREQSTEEVEGVARFSMEGSEGSGTFEQDLRLTRWGAIWKVESAGEVREAAR
jgi:hypothetical protein